MKKVDWYFDFISPFAYLASASLEQLPTDIELQPRPILFAGLLKHWQTKGPAEIDSMRQFTFRHVCWLAARAKIPMTLPPIHPFNPLKLLRLCIAEGNELQLVQRLFRFVWAQGRSTDIADHWQELIEELGIVDADVRISSIEVKTALKKNTDDAIMRGLFGVPSFVVDDEIFWGYDAMEFLVAYLQQTDLLAEPYLQAADAMPQGLRRKT